VSRDVLARSPVRPRGLELERLAAVDGERRDRDDELRRTGNGLVDLAEPDRVTAVCHERSHGALPFVEVPSCGSVVDLGTSQK
jgi:hypothetical protein